VDLEAQLSHPSQAFKQLLGAWRLLPVDVVRPVLSRPKRQRQRAEDRLGSDGVARLVADYLDGRSTKWLQRTYGLSQGAVLRLLDANGVPRRQRGLTEAQAEEAIQLYEHGWSLTRIGDHFGKDHTVVQNALRRTGVRLRP
jgi:DNA-directed RNA polymerase specialized sigma24 family protein